MAKEDSNVVIDRAQSHWSDLWKKEDYWAIWLGFAILIAAIAIFINGAPASYKETIDKSNAIMKVESEKAPFKTIAYIQAQDAKKSIQGTNMPIAKTIKNFIATPGKWTNNPLPALFVSQEEADAKNAANKEKAEAAKAKAVIAAQAEAESMKIQGEGIANQRIAIAEGLAQSLATIQDSGLSSEEANMLLMFTQRIGMMEKFAEGGSSTLVIPEDMGSTDILTQMMAAEKANNQK